VYCQTHGPTLYCQQLPLLLLLLVLLLRARGCEHMRRLGT
jgi:hypothetical protein